MTTPVQLAYKNLLLVCMACAQLWAQAQTAAPAPAPSPTLASLVRDALDSHPTTQSQRALVASAAAGVESARWQFYPTPSVSLENATTSGTDPSYQGDNRVATLRLQQPLYTGGRLTAGADKAQASLDQSQAALEESRLQLSLRVVQAYGEWLSAHLKVQASQKNEDTHNRLLRQVQRRIEEGVSAESDRVLALGRLDAVRAEVTATQVQGDMALARLGQLLGRPIVGAALTRTVATPRPVSALTAALLEQALGQSAALQKAQSQVRVQEATVVERRADLLPEIYLRAERQYGNFNFANGAPVNRFFVGVSSRLGAGLSGLSNVAAARSQLEAARARVGEARAAWWPSLSLTAQGGGVSSELSNLLKSGASTWGVGLLGALPLFDGGRREAGVNVAQAQLDGSVIAFREQFLLALKDVEDQLGALALLQAQGEANTRAVAAAGQALKLSDTRYRNGLVSQLELLDARRSELANRRAALQVRSAQYQATVGLIRALGGGWRDESVRLAAGRP